MISLMYNKNRQQLIEGLKQEYFVSIEHFTPVSIKQHPLFDLSQPGEITLTLTKKHIEEFNFDAWLARYRQEALHAIGGVRGPQNVLYPWDTRFPINQLGIVLATIGKTLALREFKPSKELHKIVAGEVRYNTEHYVELISRLHAALGITTHQPKAGLMTSIWMTSFLIFMNDFDGGEYVTASHSVSSKTATKDLDNEGAQFSAAVAVVVADKIAEVIAQAKARPEGYTITLASRTDPKIIKDFDGFDLYTDYLKRVTASPANLRLIHQAAAGGMRLMFETVGGCMYQNLAPLFERLGIPNMFDWHNVEVDPFFHGVGKTRLMNPQTGREEFFDLSCDVSLPEVQATMDYETLLKGKPIGYTILITDPDGDRLLIGQVEPSSRRAFFDEIGIDYLAIDSERIVVIYHPAYSFLQIMDFHKRQLETAGLWENHSRFMVATTPSPRSWDEWARVCGVAVLGTPVGFKEIQVVVKKVEKQLRENPGQDVVVTDIWGRQVALGRDSRLVFAGEESGGMIIGPEELVVSRGGRQALAMREKSAGEAAVVAAALASHLYLEKKLLSEHLEELFKRCNIKYRSYVRRDITFYNESEPDPVKLVQARADGERQRDQIDLFYLGLALARQDGLLSITQVREVMHEALPNLSFVALEDIIFVGDATYLRWADMFVQIRRSKNDAKLRGYANGQDRQRCQTYLEQMVHYRGDITPLYARYIPASYRDALYNRQDELYNAYLSKDY